jgi:DNA-binding transcriptional ArsR family regulator
MIDGRCQGVRRPYDGSMVAKIFKALGNETRLAIFEYVRSGDYDCWSDGEGSNDCRVNTEDRTVCVSHISRRFAHVGQTAISQHLKALHEAGLLDRHKTGTWVYYTISANALRELQTYFQDAPPPRAHRAIVSKPRIKTEQPAPR